MSYLTTPKLESFNKAVISFWFRVPQASLDAAQAELNQYPQPDNPPPLWGLVPLVVFGKEGTSSTTSEPHNNTTPLTTSTTVTTCVEHASDALDGNAAVPGTTYIMTYWAECETHTSERTSYKDIITYSAIPGKPTNPSFIAVDGYGNLQINFESTQKGDVTLAYDIASFTDKYYTQETVKECYTFQGLPGCGDFQDVVVSDGGLAGVFEIVFTILGFRLRTAVADVYIDEGSSPIVEHPAEWTYGPIPNDVGTGTIGFSPPIGLAADTWHHVVISIDMSGGSASTGFAVGESPYFEEAVKRITKTSTMYVAIDDVNYPTGGNLFPGTNKVVTGGAAQVAFMGQAGSPNADGTRTPQGPIPSYSLDNMSVPAAEVGIPSVGKYVDHIHKVEMAELLFFTGTVLDTSKEENRRLFITKKDKNGAQFPTNEAPIMVPISKYATGDPTTWEPGADTPVFVPALSSLDPSAVGSGNKLLGTPDIDFTKCSFNWMMGRNLGKTHGKVVRTGKVKAYWPPDGSDPKLESGN